MSDSSPSSVPRSPFPVLSTVALAKVDPGTILREEPGAYRIGFRELADGSFGISGSASAPVVLTVRVEDAWELLPPEKRSTLYRADVTKDGSPFRTLDSVAPDARIFIDFSESFSMIFTPQSGEDL